MSRYHKVLIYGVLIVLATPTPEVIKSDEAIPKVKFSEPSGVFTNAFTVSLATKKNLQSGDVIHYTTNGQLPSKNSAVYSSPIILKNTARIRAQVYRGRQGGDIAYASYTKLEPDVAGFSSNLPIVVIDTFSTPVSDKDDYTPALITLFDNSDGNTLLTRKPDFAGYSGIRIRGSSSRDFPKKQYKVEIWDDNQDDLDVNLLNIGKGSDWQLYAPGRYDRSMIANPLMYKLSGQIGMVEMETRFVEVYLNDGNGPVRQDDYDGIYILTETIKIDKNRVPIAKMNSDDTAQPEITGGYILAIDRADSDQYHFRTDRGVPNRSNIYLNIVRPKLVDLNNAQQKYIQQYIQDFEDTLYSSNYNDLLTGYSSYIDVLSWIDSHILRVLAMDPDILKLSNFFYKDRGGRLVNAPLWDFDRTLNSDEFRDDNPNQLRESTRGVDPVGWDWWGRLFQSDNFDFRYRTRWQQLRANVLSKSNLFTLIDSMEAEIKNAYEREYERWGNIVGYGSRYGDLRGEINALKKWLTARLAFLDRYWEIQTINSPPLVTDPGDQTGFVNNSIFLNISASDSEGDILAYFATGLPTGLTMNQSSGVITGMLSEQGIYPVKITVTDGKHDITINFSWVVDAYASSPACGEPSISSQLEHAAFLWKDCSGDGSWHFRATAGGPDTMKYEGRISSSSDFLASSVIPYMLESSDILDSEGNSNLVYFRLNMSKNRLDGFQFRHDDDATACLSLNLPVNAQVLLGENKVVSQLPLDLDKLNSSAGCSQTLPDECDVPNISAEVDKGVFIWKNCENNQWHLRVTAGGEQKAISYLGNISSDQGFSSIEEVRLERSDTVDNFSDLLNIDFDLKVIRHGYDGIDFIPMSGACLAVYSPAQASTYLGRGKKKVNMPLDLVTLRACEVTQPPS